MPNIKGKKFPYTKKGIKASKEYAESDARERSENYQFGGMVLPPVGRGLPEAGGGVINPKSILPIMPPITSNQNPLGRGRRMPPPIYKKGGKVKK